jgi:hypothetical protein
LRDVPDSAITHFAENVRLPGDSVAFGYVKQNPDPTSGTWNMSAMYFHLPPAAVMAAHRLAVKRFGSDSLPLSAKRKRYGHPPAATVRDRLEEEALKDVSGHAIAIVGMHPDLLSVEPTSAAHVQSNHISPNGFSLELSFVLESAGPATPQQTAGQPNATGWATLIPILDDNSQPFRNQNGPLNKGLIQYHPEWNAAIVPAAAGAVRTVVGPVKDDVVLGGDVTGQDPNGQGRGLSGALWKRHDGVTTVIQPGGPTAVRDTLAYTLTTQNTEGGFSCTGSAVAQSDGSALATLTFTNWSCDGSGSTFCSSTRAGERSTPRASRFNFRATMTGTPRHGPLSRISPRCSGSCSGRSSRCSPSRSRPRPRRWPCPSRRRRRR